MRAALIIYRTQILIISTCSTLIPRMTLPSSQQLKITKDVIQMANENIHIQVKKVTKYLLKKYDIPIMTNMNDKTELVVVPMPKEVYDNEDYCSNFEDIIKSVFNLFGLQTISLEWFKYDYYHTNCYRSRYWSTNVAHHIRFCITPLTGHRDVVLPVRMFNHIWDLDEQEITYTSYKENKNSIDEYFGEAIDIGTITVVCYIKEVIRTPAASPLFPITYNSDSSTEFSSEDESTEEELSPSA